MVVWVAPMMMARTVIKRLEISSTQLEKVAASLLAPSRSEMARRNLLRTPGFRWFPAESSLQVRTATRQPTLTTRSPYACRAAWTCRLETSFQASNFSTRETSADIASCHPPGAR